MMDQADANAVKLGVSAQYAGRVAQCGRVQRQPRAGDLQAPCLGLADVALRHRHLAGMPCHDLRQLCLGYPARLPGEKQHRSVGHRVFFHAPLRHDTPRPIGDNDILLHR